tara:strand:+ start:7620 stop:7925 length:306 start_codon:yes stop_codon:yes gene_type:complete
MIEGLYYDPNHGGCLRKIKKLSNEDMYDYKITGAYGDDEPETGKKWTAFIKTLKKNTFYVDFSGKTHVTHGPYTTVWNSSKRILKWEDGNTWKQLYHWYKI